MTDFNVLVGADPEMFVQREGKFVSGHGMIEGTKDAPFKVANGAVQVDGTALEFNIDPASTSQEFADNIKSVLSQMKDMIEPDLELVAIPTATYGKEYISTLPEEALELGCDPDYNAYTGEANPRPDAEVDFRTGGGHVHIGWTEGVDPNDPEHLEACRMLVRELDYSLGLASMLWDEDNKRRELYGMAGAFRAKPYGVEYRSLSNAWLKSEEHMKFVFDVTKATVDRLFEGKSFFEKPDLERRDNDGLGELAMKVINRNDVNMAKQILDFIGLEVPANLCVR